MSKQPADIVTATNQLDPNTPGNRWFRNSTNATVPAGMFSFSRHQSRMLTLKEQQISQPALGKLIARKVILGPFMTKAEAEAAAEVTPAKEGVNVVAVTLAAAAAADHVGDEPLAIGTPKVDTDAETALAAGKAITDTSKASITVSPAAAVETTETTKVKEQETANVDLAAKAAEEAAVKAALPPRPGAVGVSKPPEVKAAEAAKLNELVDSLKEVANAVDAAAVKAPVADETKPETKSDPVEAPKAPATETKPVEAPPAAAKPVAGDDEEVDLSTAKPKATESKTASAPKSTANKDK